MGFIETPRFGQPMLTGRKFPSAVLPQLGPETAMSEVLAEYLKCQTFRVYGKGAPDVVIGLKVVRAEWPDPSKAMEYPSASVIERTDTFHEKRMQPRALEETLGLYDCVTGQAIDPAKPRTCLWVTAEANAEFQVDFWCSNQPDRDAIEARLGYLFNPGEERTGVLLGGHPRYYDRAVRATLLSSRKMDTAESVYPNERRLMVIVSAQVDVVDLRSTVLLTPLATAAVTDPNEAA